MTATYYRPPTRRGDRWMNATVRWLADRGIGLVGARTLTVRGRVSGRPQRVPVNPLTIADRRYLVSPRGETQWVRNARAAGVAELRRGRRVDTVTLTEVAAADRAPVIRSYLDRWGWEVGALLPEGLGVKPDDETLAAHVDQIPVFAIS